MNTLNRNSKKLPVVLAAAVIVILGGSLGARLVARDAMAKTLTPPNAVVRAPEFIGLADLDVPCWGCLRSIDWAVRFHTDLDFLAPLGNGTANAAEWFALFTKEIGPRIDDAMAAMARRVDGPDWVGSVLPADDPLLHEAEPWCDQATMDFYPSIYEFDGYKTRVPNLLLPLNFARSWVARGLAAENDTEAMDDFRRAIRLGRLLRQEEITVIADLVALECIHLGLRGIYERALSGGDVELALLASIAVGEVAPQRFATKQHLTSTDMVDSIRLNDDGEIEFRLQPGKLDTVIETANSSPDRRFRLEAVLGLNTVRSLGTSEEKERATDVLRELAADSDPAVAAGAQWGLANEPDVEQLKEWLPKG